MAWRPVLAAALLLLQLGLSTQQGCSLGNENVRGRGAQGNGGNDDTWAFQQVESDGGAGLIYVPDGTYLITQRLTLTKPIVGTAGAVLKVANGVVLELQAQPTHPLTPFFTGGGLVIFSQGTHQAYPEWWGAVGDGRSDDSREIMKAYRSVGTAVVQFAPFGYASLHFTRRYGVGRRRDLKFWPGVVVTSERNAELVAVQGNTKGITITPGNGGIKSVLPSLTGFSDFCLQLVGLALGGFHVRSLTNCGDAIRFLGGPGVSCATNTVWFDRIVNSRVGIATRVTAPCAAGSCVFQANHVVGNRIVGGASSGPSYAILFHSPDPTPTNKPAWDSNTFDINQIFPPNNPEYRVVYVSPEADKETFKIGALHALPHPASQVFAIGPGYLNNAIVNINFAAPLQENQWGLRGEMNLMELGGALTGVKGAIRLATGPGRGGFNGGVALVGNIHTLAAVPDSDWPSGTIRQFYMYHQLGDGGMYTLKTRAALSGGVEEFVVTQFFDNGGAVYGEVQLYVLNQSGRTIGAGQSAVFKVAISTLQRF